MFLFLPCVGESDSLTLLRRNHFGSAMIPDKPKKFVCRTCDKGFKRRDVLSRHQKCHDVISTEEMGPIVSHRACTHCASARTRCSRTQPCQRCDGRKLECTFPSTSYQQTSSVPASRSTTSDTAKIRVIPHFPGETLDATSRISTNPGSLHVTEDYPSLSQAATMRPPGGSTASAHAATTMCEAPREVIIAERNHIDAVPAHPIAVPQDTLSSTANGIRLPASHSDTLEAICGVRHNEFSAEGTLPGSSINWMPLSEYSDASMNTYYNSLGEVFLPPDQQLWDYDPVPDAMEFTNNFGTGQIVEGNLETPCQSVSTGFPSNKRTETTYAEFSTASSLSKSPRPGSPRLTLYADGKGGRTASRRHLKRLKFHTRSGVSDNARFHKDHTNFQFPHIKFDVPYIPDGDFETSVDAVTYQNILQNYRSLCEGQAFPYSNFEVGSFPSLEICNLFAHIYFRDFHPFFPFIHRESFVTSKANWLLKLAVIATGAIYVDVEQHVELCEALQEFLRRAIQVDSEQGCETTLLARYQAQVLNITGMSQCRKLSLRKRAERDCAGIVGLCQYMTQDQDWQLQSSKNRSPGTQHLKWLAYHEWSRLVLFSWILSSILNLETVASVTSWTQVGELQLPIQEPAWDTPIEELKQYQNLEGRKGITLFSAMRKLYQVRKIDPTLDDFAATIVIYAICNKTQEMGLQSQQRMGRWMPTPACGSLTLGGIESASVWLPSDPTYASWRNGALDCLDVLHWQANCLTAKNAGQEAPLVVHLHLSRLLLLTPIRQMRILAENMVAAPAETDSGYQDQIHLAVELVKKWLILDQCKVRLAVIHAGSIFWSVRHFGMGSFVEPQSILIASLCLWFYAKHRDVLSQNNIQDAGMEAHHPLTEQTREHNQTNNHTQDRNEDDQDDDVSLCESDTFPEAIIIDRPLDDQLAQHFIRSGDAMTVVLAHVGSLCAPEGPSRVLLEGAKLLNRRERHWGIHTLYHDLLIKLAEGKNSAIK